MSGRARRASKDPAKVTPLGLTLRAGLTGVLCVTPVALVLSGVFGGVRGLASSAVGLALVTSFFVVSMVLVERANTVGPALTLPVALTVYGIKIVILGVIVFGTDALSHLDTPAFVWSVVAATLGWLLAHAVAVWRTKIPYVVIPPGGDGSVGRGEPPADPEHPGPAEQQNGVGGSPRSRPGG